MNAAPLDRPSGAVKAPAAPRQHTPDPSPVRWVINAKYGLGRDAYQFIVYRTIEPKSGNQRRGSHQYRPISYHQTLADALLWVIQRQVFFDDDPTISTNLLDAFQSFCHHLDQIKADIAALAERLEEAIGRQGS